MMTSGERRGFEPLHLLHAITEALDKVSSLEETLHPLHSSSAPASHPAQYKQTTFIKQIPKHGKLHISNTSGLGGV
jgi:hypothetical protein